MKRHPRVCNQLKSQPVRAAKPAKPLAPTSFQAVWPSVGSFGGSHAVCGPVTERWEGRRRTAQRLLAIYEDEGRPITPELIAEVERFTRDL